MVVKLDVCVLALGVVVESKLEETDDIDDVATEVLIDPVVESVVVTPDSLVVVSGSKVEVVSNVVVAPVPADVVVGFAVVDDEEPQTPRVDPVDPPVQTPDERFSELNNTVQYWSEYVSEKPMSPEHVDLNDEVAF